MNNLTPTEQAEVDHLIRTLREIGWSPERFSPSFVAWAADEAACLLRKQFPIDYSSPPPPCEGMVSLFTESQSHGEG